MNKLIDRKLIARSTVDAIIDDFKQFNIEDGLNTPEQINAVFERFSKLLVSE